MKGIFAAALLVSLAIVSAAPSRAADRNVLAPIQSFVRAANAGDRAALVATFRPDSSIVDEFAPFAFPAPAAAAHWYDGFGADQKANGVTDAVIATRRPKFVTVSGSRAYIVVPTAYSYRLHGKPARESGSLAFALRKTAGRWKIAAMAWAKLTDTSIP